MKVRRQVRWLAPLALLVGALGLSGPASAQPVTFVAQGTVSFVDPALGGSFSVGDSFGVQYTFESTAPDASASPNAGRYAAITDMALNVGSYSAAASGGAIFIDFNLGGRDAYQFSASGPPFGSLATTAGSLPGNFRASLVAGLLVAPGGTALSSDALLTSPPDPADFPTTQSLVLIFQDPQTRDMAMVIADWTYAGGASANAAPDCSGAASNPATLWPPSHTLRPVSVAGVSDPDGDPVSLTVMGVFQDEPVAGGGAGSTAPDATGLGSDAPELRAERAGGGDGRVYHVMFTAEDGNGGSCTGEVTVAVPHDSKGGGAVDGGPLFDSTAP